MALYISVLRQPGMALPDHRHLSPEGNRKLADAGANGEVTRATSVARIESTVRANARPMTGSVKSGDGIARDPGFRYAQSGLRASPFSAILIERWIG
jgi:hypothetical protein